MSNFYISDWHYGHKNIITFDKRPFETVEEMNEALIKNWNSVVGKDDHVYILGDMFWTKSSDAVPILQQLAGVKHLIRGNHDRSNDGKFARCFAQITEYLEVKDDNKKIILCHYPIPYFKNHYYDHIHFYGHVHSTKEYSCVLKAQQDLIDNGFKCDMYNVGCMMPWMNYTPQTADWIINNSQEK